MYTVGASNSLAHVSTACEDGMWTALHAVAAAAAMHRMHPWSSLCQLRGKISTALLWVACKHSVLRQRAACKQ